MGPGGHGLVVPGFIEFGDNGTREFGFIAVRGSNGLPPGERGERASMEFSWQDDDEGDRGQRAGLGVLADDGSLRGIFFRLGDDSGSAPCASGGIESLPQRRSVDDRRRPEAWNGCPVPNGTASFLRSHAATTIEVQSRSLAAPA